MDGRISVVVEPGVVETCPNTVGSSGLCTRSAGPGPRHRIANGRITDATLELHVANVAAEQRFAARLLPLATDEPQDPRCGREQLGVRPGTSIDLAPLQGATLPLEVPACSALALYAVLPPDQEIYRIAVFGDVVPDVARFEEALDALLSREHPPDYLQLVGDVGLPGTDDRYEQLSAVLDPLGVPWGMALTRADLRGDRDRRAIDRLGSMDGVSVLGQSRYVVLDTAERTVSDNQLALVGRMGSCLVEACLPGVALMWSPPVSPGAFWREGFTSAVVGQRLLSGLVSHGVSQVVSGAEDRERSGSAGGVAVLDVGPMSRGGSGLRYTELRVVQPWSRLPSCTSELDPLSPSRISRREDEVDCGDGETCVRGLCHVTCDDARPCPSDEVCAGNGTCRRPCDEDLDCGPVGRCAGGLCDEWPRFETEPRELP